ncbi:MAG: DUF1592 domain-containing protein [Bryobacterales bacterium]|nr:DUF1592 domain-containing protein [Bryobacterales bacterium]
MPLQPPQDLGVWRRAGRVAAVTFLITTALTAADATATFRQYCYQCHGSGAQMAGLSLERLAAQGALGDNFRPWEKVATALSEKKMPPKGMPQPSDEQRAQAVSWIKTELAAYAKAHAGDPGKVTVRRLTSGEYAYAIEDLTGLPLDTGIDASSDSVGGEGFSNFGDVQFMQDAGLERYLQSARRIAGHSITGAGPLQFFSDPGKTGFESSAITRIRDIYAAHGFRTVSGEGGRPFGLDLYGKAFYVAWRFQHRATLGEAAATVADLARREAISPRFAQHIWDTMNRADLGYPSSEVAARWRKLPMPGTDPQAGTAAARAACAELQKFVTTWPSWLFARGDLAAGGAGDESPLEFSSRTLKADPVRRLAFIRRGRGPREAPPTGSVTLYLNVAPVNPQATAKPMIIWRNPTVGIRPLPPPRAPNEPAPLVTAAEAQEALASLRRGAVPLGPRQSLPLAVSAETARKLNFGIGPIGVPIGPNDFAAPGSVSFEVIMPPGRFTMDFQVDAEIAGDPDQVLRVTISDRPEGGAARGTPVHAFLGDMTSAGYRAFHQGVMELAAVLPPNSNSEPTPADKDPVPDPFDNTYNVPEHDDFVTSVKYIREDRFIYEHILDDATRRRLDSAWSDLYSSFAYHDNYLMLLARKYDVNLKGKGIAQLTAADFDAMPPEARKYAQPLRAEYDAVMAAQAAARRGHLQDCLQFASRAWRRPLTEQEKANLRGFYDQAITAEGSHRKAIEALLARILVSPSFLYRVEQVPATAGIRPLSNFELASRMSFFLWSSIPDDELRRAAAAGELNNPQRLQLQVQRMLADPKARRFATEFFGQWLGFYHFDQHRGVDTGRFPEFTSELKSAMYDEAVSFFEHIVRQQRPVNDLIFADYAFLNKGLAKHYGAPKEVKSADRVELVTGANAFDRGGLLRLGAILTATSAPLRTSPVKRGDWVLRRILGTPVPPPPADAGSLPADDKNFGGLSVRAKLESHKRNATCAGCHTRIDPLGFPLERYDSIGRLRQAYPDGKPIEDFGTLSDKTEVSGVNGLLDYLRTKDAQVRRTLSDKLVGYALGRTVMASDQELIDRMVAAGPRATFSQLAAEIVTSRQFLNHRGRQSAPRLTANTTPRQGPK